MSEAAYDDVTETARDYYNSDDADNFYFHVWGGEDIHIGLYRSDDEDIATASARTVDFMADRLDHLGKDARILDVGAGYGGAARHLAKRLGCHVTALNLSEKENERDRVMNEEQGLAHLIDVVDGAFEELPFPDAHFDAVWSQDAILHSGDRDTVMAEVARVMKPGGHFVFTDPMESGKCSKADIQPVLERIHLDSLGAFDFYEKSAAKHGLEKVELLDMTEQLVRHYSRVGEELRGMRDKLKGRVSDAYVDRMLEGLRNWVAAGKGGCLAWGVLHFRKT